jgi:coproporphyrinogen III oxidase-like Fe-S oxidoreductase
LNNETPAKSKSGYITFEDLLFQRMIISTYMNNLNYTNDISDLYIANNDANFKFQVHKWRNNDLIGIGTNSHGYINGVFYRNFCSAGNNSLSISGYIDMVEKSNHGISLCYNLNDKEKDKRRICLGLKLNEYLEYHKTIFIPFIEQLVDAKLIVRNGDCIKLSKEGFLTSDIIIRYLSEDESIWLRSSCNQRNRTSMRTTKMEV